VGDDNLYPSVEELQDRLSQNQRERHRLRTLLRLIRHKEGDDPSGLPPTLGRQSRPVSRYRHQGGQQS
jgi:hypothetical protein